MLINKTKNIIISKDVRYCRSFFSKAIGLMFSKKIDKPLIFIFNREDTYSIHMFFVFFPIDVIWLDKDKKAVFIKESVKPFSFIKPKKKSNYLIELRKGDVGKYKIEIDNIINF